MLIALSYLQKNSRTRPFSNSALTKFKTKIIILDYFWVLVRPSEIDP